MVSTGNLTAEKLFSVKGLVCVVTVGGTGIGLMYFVLPQSLIFTNPHRAIQALAANGGRVYTIGRRAEVLQNAAKTHSPKSGDGEIIPYSLPLSPFSHSLLITRSIGPCDVTKKGRPRIPSLSHLLQGEIHRSLSHQRRHLRPKSRAQFFLCHRTKRQPLQLWILLWMVFDIQHECVFRILHNRSLSTSLTGWKGGSWPSIRICHRHVFYEWHHAPLTRTFQLQCR